MPNTDKRDNLLRRSRIAAMVLGNSDGFELFYLGHRNSDESILAAAMRGLSSRGVIGLTRDGVEFVVGPAATPQDEWLNNRIMEDARMEFETALKLVHAPSAAA